MGKVTKTFYFHGSTELDDILREFQKKNNIESKSKAIKVLLDTGLRNWSHPMEAKEYVEQPDPQENPTNIKSKINEFYALITGEEE